MENESKFELFETLLIDVIIETETKTNIHYNVFFVCPLKSH